MKQWVPIYSDSTFAADKITEVFHYRRLRCLVAGFIGEKRVRGTCNINVQLEAVCVTESLLSITRFEAITLLAIHVLVTKLLFFLWKIFVYRKTIPSELKPGKLSRKCKRNCITMSWRNDFMLITCLRSKVRQHVMYWRMKISLANVWKGATSVRAYTYICRSIRTYVVSHIWLT